MILVFMLILVLYEDKVILLQWGHGPIHCSQIYETDSNASNPDAPGNPQCQVEFEVN